VIREEGAKHVLPIPVRLRMLLPDQRIGGDRRELGVVGFTQRPHLDELAHQVRLGIEHLRP